MGQGHLGSSGNTQCLKPAKALDARANVLLDGQPATGRGHKVTEGSARIGASQHRLYKWIKAHGLPAPERQVTNSQAEELRRLKAELKRVTEARDILKRAAAYFAKQSG